MKRNLEEWIKRFADFFLAVFMFLMFVIVCLQVFFRYVLEKPLSWSEELALYIFVWISFIGGAVALGQRLHFGIDYLVNKLPPRFSASVEILASLLSLVFVLMLIFKGYETTIAAKSFRSAGMEIRMDAVYASIPISAVIMAYYLIGHIVQASEKLRGRTHSK